MPRIELTKAAVERIRNTRYSRKMVYLDTDIRGLLLEYRPGGVGTWYFRAKDERGKSKMLRLGLLADMDLLEAKAQAYELQKFVEDSGKLGVTETHSGSRLTFGTFIEKYYLPHARARKRSWKTEAGILRRHVLPLYSGVKLEAITRFRLSRWLEGLQDKGLSPATCNRALFLVKYIFNCARRWGFLGESPARDVSALPEREFQERYLSAEEARRLLEVLDEEKVQQAACAVKLLLFTGARKSEILAARWQNVDMGRRILTVPLSKSGKKRHIPLSDAALQVLESIPRSSEWLFPSPRKDSHIRSIYLTWDRARTKAGLKDVRLHDLRHSFASFLVNSGCSLYEVQKILGHQNPKVTTRYAHLAQESLVRAANIVGEKIGKTKNPD
ncbi:tyrosine-type recombinase/integrase [Mailhella sp.]